jgi:hypothetical protein
MSGILPKIFSLAQKNSFQGKFKLSRFKNLFYFLKDYHNNDKMSMDKKNIALAILGKLY